MKKNKKIIGFILLLFFCIIFSTLFKWVQTGDPFQPSTVLFGTIILVLFLVSLGISNKFFPYFLNIPSKQLKKRIAPIFILFLLIILLVSLIIIGLSIYVFYQIMGFDATNFMNILFKIEFPEAIKMYSIFALLASVFFFYTKWHQTVDQEQQLREENLKYRYRTLKTQVNPHFLFNSLNTLSEMVYVDAKKADNYIQKLSGIYRYILDNEETDLILLNEEIGFVRQYFDLQKERDENKIRLDIDIENAEKFKVVPISLQILAENALKHNVVSEEKPLKIRVHRNGEYIEVSNNIQRKSILNNNSTGTGLSNLKERVRLITGKEVTISQENNLFLVKLPIISI